VEDRRLDHGHPPADDNDPTWVSMSTTAGLTLTAAGRTHTAPGGFLPLGLFDERNPNPGGEIGRDVNRDGNQAGSSGLFGVRDGGTTVWSTQPERLFADQAAMTDRKVRHDGPVRH
jgi:hypothetical protein